MTPERIVAVLHDGRFRELAILDSGDWCVQICRYGRWFSWYHPSQDAILEWAETVFASWDGVMSRDS